MKANTKLILPIICLKCLQEFAIRFLGAHIIIIIEFIFFKYLKS